MKFIIPFVLISTALSTVALAQSEAVAILPFESGGEADSATANAVTGFVQNAFAQHKIYRVLERRQIQKVLNEQRFQITGVTEHAVEVGKLFAVNKVATGQVTKLGKEFTLVINLIDVKTGELVKSQKRSAQITIEAIGNELVDPMVEQFLSIKKRSGFTMIIKKGTSIEKMDVLSATDAWIQVTVGNRFIGRTEVVKNSNSPEFNERFEVSEYAGEQIILTVYDRDVSRNRLIGNVTLSEPKSGKYQIVDTVNGQNFDRGQLEIVFE